MKDTDYNTTLPEIPGSADGHAERTGISPWFLPLIFLAAGFLNGFAGAGGGMITGIFLPFYFRGSGEETEKTFAYTALAVLLFSTVSAVGYLAMGRFSPIAAAKNALPALVGGAIGGFLLKKIRPTVVKNLFALLLLYAGVRFLLG